MKYPKVIAANAIDENNLLIEFDNSTKKIYDIRPLLEKPMFAPLRNYALFKNVHIDKNGYAIYWNEDIDLSEYELWTKGRLPENE